MSEQLGIGKIIVGEQHRDAIHVAVMPVVLGEGMGPGDESLYPGRCSLPIKLPGGGRD
jgi:hypothetical protein